MPRPDPSLLRPERYPFHVALPSRFADLDVNLHINNVAMMGLAQEGRVRFHERYAGWPDSRAYALVVASFTIDFLDDGFYPDVVDVAAGISAIGRTSHTLVQLLSQGGRPVAFSTATMVRSLDGKPIVNDPDFSSGLQPWLMPA